VTTITHLECSRCRKTHPHDRLQNVCSCGAPLLARYDLAKAARTLTREALAMRPRNIWRYGEILPARDPVTLGEGMTPVIHARRLGARLGLSNLFIKDEGLNPTGSFKARGLAAAVSSARELGAQTLAIPTAGNAGGALAAYAAAAGIRAVIVMPADAPAANRLECRAFGADVRLIEGLISDCARYVREHAREEGWFDVSTLREPYRIEGKKTMALELREQFQTGLPRTIVYPTGGGVGMIGMWKAMEEMEALGWIGPERPRMVAVQAAGCAPVIEAFEKGGESCEAWEDARTIASGLRVPKPLGDFLILEAIRASDGAAVRATDDEILAAGRELARSEGIFAAPEGAAAVVAAEKLSKKRWLDPEETVLLFNTGSGYKYLELWRQALEA
jgi:threonine synthase